MKNKKYWLAGGFVVVFAVAGAVGVMRGGRKDRMGDEAVSPDVSADQSNDRSIVFAPDDAGARQTSDGEAIIKSETGDFSFAMSSTAYLERNDSTGLVVYPDYDPQGDSQNMPDCKIEVSKLGALGDVKLDRWITERLKSDPTAEMKEISRTVLRISGMPSVEWRGILNGATTTLVYVSAKGSVFEITPSTLHESSEADNDTCDNVLREFRSNLYF